MKSILPTLILFVLVFNSCKKSDTTGPSIVGTFTGTAGRNNTNAPDTVIITSGTSNGGTYYTATFGADTSVSGSTRYLTITNPIGSLVWNSATDSVTTSPEMLLVAGTYFQVKTHGVLFGNTLILRQDYFVNTGGSYYAQVWSDSVVVTKQ